MSLGERVWRRVPTLSKAEMIACGVPVDRCNPRHDKDTNISGKWFSRLSTVC